MTAQGLFAGESSFASWLYRIEQNVCFDALRKRRPRTGAAVIERKILIFGRWKDNETYISEGALFDPETGVWRRLAGPPSHYPAQIHPGW